MYVLVKQVRRGCNQMYTFVLEPGGGRRSTRHLEVIVKQKFSTLEQTLPNKNVTYTPGGGKKISKIYSPTVSHQQVKTTGFSP